MPVSFMLKFNCVVLNVSDAVMDLNLWAGGLLEIDKIGHNVSTASKTIKL